jgi:hypothetical protein
MNATEVLNYLKVLSPEEFVLHGSPHKTAVLEPKQAECLKPDGSKDWEKSQRGVYASISIETTVICSVLHNHAGWSVDNDRIEIYVNGKDVTLGQGYIYILRQKNFRQLSNRLWFIAYYPVRPVVTLTVGPDILKLLPNIIVPPYLLQPAQ